MDLKNLSTAKAANDGAVLTLRHPVTGEKLDRLTITLRGKDSKTYRDMRAKMARESMQQKGADVVELSERMAMENRIACTVTWSLVLDGKPLEFSVDAAKELYGDVGYAWLVDQVDAFIADRSNFLPSA